MYLKIDLSNFLRSGHFPVAMLNWLMKQVNEVSVTDEEVKWKFGILYDIGCNLEKGIKKVSM